MKEFFGTILVIVIIFGVFFMVAYLPFFIRNVIVRIRRDKRQKRFLNSVASEKKPDQIEYFEFTVRLYKKDLMNIVSLKDRLHSTLIGKVFVTMFFGMGLIKGLWGISKMISGKDPHEFGNWLISIIWFLLGLFVIWITWIIPWLMRKRISASSDMEISMDSDADYVIGPEGIVISYRGQEVARPRWEEVDSVREERGALLIVSKSKDFIWIPEDALFRRGDWKGLNDFLKPLMKNN